MRPGGRRTDEGREEAAVSRARWWTTPVLLAGLLVLTAPGGTPAPEATSSVGVPGPVEEGPPPHREGAADELERLYRERDYFGLRAALEESEVPASPRARFLRAAVLHAFNRPGASLEVVDGILAGPEPVTDTLRARVHRLRYHNFLRLHRYDDAVAAGEAVLAVSAAGERLVADVRNELRALRALAGTRPQQVTRRSPTILQRRAGRIPVSVDGALRRYGMDTGANFSVLMRSEARALGLEVRPAGVELGTATDLRVTADVAVAPRVQLGGIELRDVVFLVLPDAALTFPGGFQVRGIIGFPVLEALGVIRFRSDGSVEVPEGAGADGPPNLALEQLTPLVRVGFREHDLVCRLDTGAGRTNFYEPFLRRHGEFVRRHGRPHTTPAVGAGGMREVRAFRLSAVRLEVGGRRLEVEEVDVYRQALVEEGANYLACNLGRDVLDGHGGYEIDFRSMSLTLF